MDARSERGIAMIWNTRAQTLLDIYAKDGKNVEYIRKASEAQAKEDESKTVYRTHVLYVMESVK
jgi:hypothetical protein